MQNQIVVALANKVRLLEEYNLMMQRSIDQIASMAKAKPEELDAYNKRVIELEHQLRQLERELSLLEQEDKRKTDEIYAQRCENAKVLQELKKPYILNKFTLIYAARTG
jgi:predicted  nucleic acid-binding Zn-ribbon protein